MSSNTWPTQSKQSKSQQLGYQSRWSEHPERLAWLVLLSSFAIFVLLMVTIPLAAFYAIEHSSVNRPAQLESTLGTLLLKPFRGSELIAVTSQREDIGVGSVIEAAGGTTQGTLSFVSSSEPPQTLGSMQIYAGTSIEVERIREPFFERSTQPYQVTLRLLEGQARIFNDSQLGQRALRVNLIIPHGSVIMNREGTYEVSTAADQTDVIVRSGFADVRHSNGQQELVGTGIRIGMSSDGLLQKDAQQNLIVNGNFAQDNIGDVEEWSSQVFATNANPGSVQFVEREGRKLAFFTRTVGEDAHTEVDITQEIQKDVSLYNSLVLQFDVRLLNQSLAGGGMLGSEFPLRVELFYTDIFGKVVRWGHGFYYSDLLDDADPNNDNWILDRENNDKIPQGQWYTYRSPNLITLFTDQQTPPAQINSIRFYASGHKYMSFLSEVYLFAE